MGMEAALPSEVRRRVLEQHKTIRDRVEALETLALRIAGGSVDPADIAAELKHLLSLLGTHMRFEDRVLPELLREADAWGDARVERFNAEHTQQRAMIENLVEVVSQRADWECALLALGFCALLRADMVAEERIFLAEDVLRDDPIAVQPEPE